MIISIIIALVLLCIALYAIQRFLPGDPPLKGIICLLVCLAVCVWIAKTAGLF